MDAETLEALNGSIRKWEAIVAGTGADSGPDNCPLCLRFHVDYRTDGGTGCSGCPVAEAGYRHCAGSPYDDYCDTPRALPDAVQAAAEKELAFLQSLLPAETSDAR
jgi:hypothetical protein